MKTLFLPFILLIALRSNAADSVPGRYLLSSGTFYVPSHTVSIPAVFKIDTATGRTWIFRAGVITNVGYSEFWDEIKEKPISQVDRLAKLQQLMALVKWADDHKDGGTYFSLEMNDGPTVLSPEAVARLKLNAQQHIKQLTAEITEASVAAVNAENEKKKTNHD